MIMFFIIGVVLVGVGISFMIPNVPLFGVDQMTGAWIAVFGGVIASFALIGGIYLAVRSRRNKLEKGERISGVDQPRKVRRKDLAAGIVAIVIGLIFIIAYVIIAQIPYGGHFYFAAYFPYISIVFIIIGIAHMAWKYDRNVKGKH
jgi:hypothetical protein